MQEKILEDEDAVRDVCASHSNQVLALNCKVEALAIIKALIAGEYETTRGSIETIVDPVRSESWDWLDEFFNLNVVRKCQIFQGAVLWGKVAFRSSRSWSTRRGKFRFQCQTIVKFPSSAV